MTVSVPLVAVFGLGAYVAWRFMGLRIWHAVLCLLFGFFLAATDVAPDIRRLVSGIARWLTGA